MPANNFLSYFSKHFYSRIISETSSFERRLLKMKKEKEKIREFFYFPDLTFLEKKMIEDWVDHVFSFTPPKLPFKAIQTVLECFYTFL